VFDRRTEVAVRTFVFRLQPGEDLKLGILQFAARHGLRAPVVLTCVGSLRTATLRLAGRPEPTVRSGPFEIISLVGLADPAKGHLHIGLADAVGVCFGGHLLDGCPIHTTAEVVLGELPDVEFVREPDAATGYRELVVRSTDR
jgi:uncharacterized protein